MAYGWAWRLGQASSVARAPPLPWATRRSGRDSGWVSPRPSADAGWTPGLAVEVVAWWERIYLGLGKKLPQILGCALAARASIFCGLLLDGPELKIGFYRI
jgi:hypothetical protein